jgi:ubiquitin-protein ligase
MASSHVFSSEIQSKRVEKGPIYSELQLLANLPSSFSVIHTKTPFGLVLSVELQADVAFPERESTRFEILLEGSYPFQAPKVLCKSPLARPSLSDGRDVLKEVINTQWSPSLTMNQLIVQLPAFVVSSTQAKLANLPLSQLSDIGTFHLGHPMQLALWEGQELIHAFECVEVEAEASPARVLVITEVAVLLLEPSLENRDYGHLLSWANFQSIERITKSRQSPDRLTFHWKALEDFPACKQTLSVQETDACLELINSNMQRLGITEESRHWIAEEEVSATALNRVNIDELLEEVQLYEGYVKVRESPETIAKLLNAYQQVIEYFSAVNDPQFAVYLEKMHALFLKETQDTEE